MGPLDYSLVKENFDFDSVKKIIGKSKQVSVYGWGHCHYSAVSSALSGYLEKVFDYQLGDDWSAQTVEGRSIEKILVHYNPKPNKQFNRKCKAGITNLLLENYKRIKEHKEIIPLIFCIDTDGNRFVTSSETISSKDLFLNNKITHSELRHCYKLHCELANSSNPEFQEMSDVAKKMLKFVKVTMKDKKVILEEVPALWDWVGLPQGMKERTEKEPAVVGNLKESLSSRKKPENSQWRVQLLSAAKRFDVSTVSLEIRTQIFTLKH